MAEEPTEGFSDSEREALAKLEFAVCVGDFYEELAEKLLNGAAEGFAEGGVSEASIHTYRVPGAFELPLAASLCAKSGRFGGARDPVGPARDRCPVRIRCTNLRDDGSGI